MEDNNNHNQTAPVTTSVNTESATPPPMAVPASESQKEDSTAGSGMDNKKLYGIIGYIIPILFFLPLIDEKLKTDTSARFHANQQLILLIVAFGLHFVITNVLAMILGPLAYMLGSAVNIVVLIFVVLGVMNILKGEDKELPLIGGFRIIK